MDVLQVLSGGRRIAKEAVRVTIETTKKIAKNLEELIKEKQKSTNPNDFKNFENYIELKNDKYTVEQDVEDEIKQLAEKFKNKYNEDQIEKQIRKQIDLKVEYLNTILKKYEALKLKLKDGKNKANYENKTIKIPFSLQVENRMKKFINSEKMYEPQTKNKFLKNKLRV